MAAEELFGVTFIPHETAALKEMLEIPIDYEISALIPIGYPKEYGVKQRTVSLSEKIHFNKS